MRRTAGEATDANVKAGPGVEGTIDGDATTMGSST